jgi:hypothetical protein
MEDIFIPFMLWFNDELPPPDLAAMRAPVAIPVSLRAHGLPMRRNVDVAREQPKVSASGEADV